ncbi:hypothetical protein HWQ46_13825 [Shewanella sp. D64]|uniref:hypothetical protein n=1 Tax=unclassified Shewanella TaxID=196818 RepID=UPI0022BA2F91|nr:MULTISPECIES: hypothetical protein [unclassified Shewanella]MEC4726629.1 hypothetical protein [Shewanella sp. D64]MEC4739007.1 hypothetical protein [Shewanella sp. E94]WBJ96846.1 hypothetical protein HWQ47_06930 [Shewanella sp. MTB7]
MKAKRLFTVFGCTLLAGSFLSVPVVSAVDDGVSVKTPPTGTIMRGKGPSGTSYCDLARGTNVDGGYCQILWKDLQTGRFSLKQYNGKTTAELKKDYLESKFDFTLIEEAIASAQTFNSSRLVRLKKKQDEDFPDLADEDKLTELADEDKFKVLLRIRAGVDSPQWVKDKTKTVDWYFKNFSDTQKYDLPAFWTKAYQDSYLSLMRGLAVKYDDNELLGTVAASMCMTTHAEIMWNRTGRKKDADGNEVNNASGKNPRQVNIAAMTDSSVLGTDVYTNAKDYACLKKQVSIHDSTWKRTPSIFGSHLYQKYYLTEKEANKAAVAQGKKRSKIDAGDATTVLSKTRNIFNHCRDTLGDRCVLGNNSLRDDEEATNDNIYDVLLEMGPPLYFQTNVFGSVDDGKDPKDAFSYEDMLAAMTLAGNWGAFMVEMAMGWDCENEYDKTTCDKANEYSEADSFTTPRSVLKQNSTTE